MYFTLQVIGGILKPERGNTSETQAGDDKGGGIMLKKLIDFIEEYYEEFSHSEKW
ncbi:MAG: hypothetical protein K6G12_05680 [Lachnospiraceae bacterium]|nr:hypothetical protein [Lachnospiraceae bacterium]